LPTSVLVVVALRPPLPLPLLPPLPYVQCKEK
jgi:hypothetical protein